jgi:beta-glucosidase
MSEGILEGNIDSVCNQSGGMIKHSTIQRIVDSANRRAKNEG